MIFVASNNISLQPSSVEGPGAPIDKGTMSVSGLYNSKYWNKSFFALILIVYIGDELGPPFVLMFIRFASLILRCFSLSFISWARRVDEKKCWLKKSCARYMRLFGHLRLRIYVAWSHGSHLRMVDDI